MRVSLQALHTEHCCLCTIVCFTSKLIVMFMLNLIKWTQWTGRKTLTQEVETLLQVESDDLSIRSDERINHHPENKPPHVLIHIILIGWSWSSLSSLSTSTNLKPFSHHFLSLLTNHSPVSIPVTIWPSGSHHNIKLSFSHVLFYAQQSETCGRAVLLVSVAASCE